MISKLYKQLTMRTIIIALLALCFTDAVLTDYGIRADFIEESNPLVRRLHEWHIGAYYTVKLLLPLLLLILYPHIQQKKWLKSLLVLPFLLYAAVNLYHLVWLTLVLRADLQMQSLF